MNLMIRRKSKPIGLLPFNVNFKLGELFTILMPDAKQGNCAQRYDYSIFSEIRL